MQKEFEAMRGIFFAHKCMHILLLIAKDEIQKLDVNKRHTYAGAAPFVPVGITIIDVVIIDTGYVSDAFDFRWIKPTVCLHVVSKKKKKKKGRRTC